MEIDELKDVELDLQTIVGSIHDWLEKTLLSWGVSESLVMVSKMIVITLITIVTVYILQKVTKIILNFISDRAYKLTNIDFFKFAQNNRLPHFLALIIPYTFIRGVIRIIFEDFQFMITPLIKLTDIYAVFMVIWTLVALIKSFGDILSTKPAFHKKPMKSYVQVVQIIFYIIGAGSVYCIITDKSLGTFFTAMGAASAVLLLMFKDTIMGFVGSIQISTNNMVQIGDWITMNKYGADGDVEEVNLTTVKVRNFDKTITTIPTYALISDSFQNWRGMRESGGRRLKRAIYIKQLSIRFINNEEIDKYKKVPGLAEYIDTKTKTFSQRADWDKMDSGLTAEGHMLTNIDVYIAYCINYLKHHPNIHQSLTLMVRELAPVSTGLPVEIYTFTNTTVWKEYETIVAELMNHLICATHFFGLTVYEESSGSDDFPVLLTDMRAK